LIILILFGEGYKLRAQCRSLLLRISCLTCRVYTENLALWFPDVENVSNCTVDRYICTFTCKWFQICSLRIIFLALVYVAVFTWGWWYTYFEIYQQEKLQYRPPSGSSVVPASHFILFLCWYCNNGFHCTAVHIDFHEIKLTNVVLVTYLKEDRWMHHINKKHCFRSFN
jgi:hypothetical protein